MDNRRIYTEKLTARLNELDAEIKRFEARLNSKKVDMQVEYQQQIDELKKSKEQAAEKLKQVNESGGEAWQEMKDGLEKSWLVLEESIKNAWTKFK